MRLSIIAYTALLAISCYAFSVCPLCCSNARCALASSSSSPSSCAPCTAVHRQRHHGRPCAVVPAERSKRARHHGRPLLSRTSTPQRQQHPESCLRIIIGVWCNGLQQQHHAAVAPTTTTTTITPQRLQRNERAQHIGCPLLQPATLIPSSVRHGGRSTLSPPCFTQRHLSRTLATPVLSTLKPLRWLKPYRLN